MSLTLQQAAEVPLAVVKYPHPTLMAAAQPVDTFDPLLKTVVEKMFQVMYLYRGQGLAAPQLDLPYRIIVVNTYGDPKRRDREKAFINPVIVPLSEQSITSEEGCLSLPRVKIQISRPSSFQLQALSPKGEPVSLNLSSQTGSLGRCVMHEVDHLNGILIWDHLPSEDKAVLVRDFLCDQSGSIAH